jgi:hypothetical protein
MLTVACASEGPLIGRGELKIGPVPLDFGRDDPENAVCLEIDPPAPVEVRFLYSSVVPEGGRLRATVKDPGDWPFYGDPRLLTEVQTAADGSFPAESIVRLEEATVVLIYCDIYDADTEKWREMDLTYPLTDDEWLRLFAKGERETDLIRWAVDGDPLRGSLGVRIEVLE